MELDLNILDRIRSFLLEEIVADPGGEVDADTPLLNGMIDSLGLMQLVAYIEEDFEIEIPHTDISIDHFATLGTLSAFVEGLCANAATIG